MKTTRMKTTKWLGERPSSLTYRRFPTLAPSDWRGRLFMGGCLIVTPEVTRAVAQAGNTNKHAGCLI